MFGFAGFGQVAFAQGPMAGGGAATIVDMIATMGVPVDGAATMGAAVDLVATYSTSFEVPATEGKL